MSSLFNIGEKVKKKHSTDGHTNNAFIVIGFYRSIPDIPVECDILQEVLNNEEIAEKKAGIYVEKISIAPCTVSEAEVLFLKHSSDNFIALEDLELIQKTNWDKTQVDIQSRKHEKKIIKYENGDLMQVYKIPKL